MSEDINVSFYNKYVNVLKSKYDVIFAENINLETQLSVTRDALQSLSDENNNLKKELKNVKEELEAKKSTAKKKLEEVDNNAF